jgi:hypothetical protein
MKTRIILNPSAGAVENSDELWKRFRRLEPNKICVTSEAGYAEKFARARHSCSVFGLSRIKMISSKPSVAVKFTTRNVV